MCKSRPPTMPGESVIGVSSHISLIENLDVGASVAVAVLLLLFLCCLFSFRQGWCLTTILGRKWAHIHPDNRALTTVTPQQTQPSTIITMPATTTTTTTANPILESLNEELLILQKKNEIIKLQKERASIMELTPATYNLPYNPKYPVT